MSLIVCVAYPHGDLDRGLTLQEDEETAGSSPQLDPFLPGAPGYLGVSYVFLRSES